MQPSSATLLDLAQRLRALSAAERSSGLHTLPLTDAGLAPLFPESQLPLGVLIELLVTEAGCGALTLALALGRQACRGGRGMIVIDTEHCFYPLTLAAWDLPWSQLLVVRPPSAKQALAAFGQALRSPAAGAVVGRCDRLSSTDARRLQAAAEAGGGVGFLLRPAAARAAPSFAAIRWIVAPAPSHWGHRRLWVEAVRWQGPTGQPLLVEIDDAKGTVRVVSELADSATLPSRSRATG